MRIQTIATKYPAYLDQFYARRPGLANRPYSEQRDVLMAHSFGAPESRTAAFGRLGYVTDHVFANAGPMQKRWAMENGIVFDSIDWVMTVVEHQVRHFRPDVLFYNCYSASTPSFMEELKDACPSIRLVLGWRGETTFDDPSVLREHDIMFSCNPATVEHIRRNGRCCYHLDHAFDPRVLERIDGETSSSSEFVFVGSIVRGEEFHNRREGIILELLKKTNLRIWTDVPQPSSRERIRVAARQLAYDVVQGLPNRTPWRNVVSSVSLLSRVAESDKRPALSRYVDPRIAHCAQSPLFGLDMFQRLRDSKVVLNVHGDNAGSTASNMRLYEVTGIGTCLLTDWKENITDLFEPEAEVVTYRDVEECIEKVQYLLDHDKEREEIAAAGQRRTLKDHTVKQRAEQIDHIIQSHFRGKDGL